MNKSDFKLKRQIENVYKMFKYGYLEDFYIHGENVKYGNNKKQLYKVYKCDKNSDKTIFFIHGGGWCQGSPSLYSGVGKFFCKMGYNSVIVGYRLVPKYTYPCQVDDCFKALKHFLTCNLSDKIVIGGYSAGAELASRMIFDSERQSINNIDVNRIKGFFSIAGVLNFELCSSRQSRKLIKNYLNGKELKNTSPISMIKDNVLIPILCIHGNKDTLIDVQNSISFSKKLKEFCNNVKLIVIDNIDHEHAIDIVRGPGNKYSKELINFIDKLQ